MTTKEKTKSQEAETTSETEPADVKPQSQKEYDKRLSQVEKQIGKLQSQVDSLEKCLNDQRNYSKGFYDGRRYIVSRAEQILCEQTGCRSREKLAASGKIPPFWAATLVLCLDNPPGVIAPDQEIEEKTRRASPREKSKGE